jgi:general secretion pathway protein J
MSAALSGRTAGFTLLEVLVGLVILGFVVSGLAGSTRFGLAAAGTQSRIVLEHEDLEPADRLLRRLVAGMALPNDGRQSGLVGDRTGFACVTRAPAAQGPGLTGRVDAVMAVNGAHQLVLRWSPHWHAERLAPRSPPAEEVLLQGVDRLDVSYLSPDRGGWLGAWNRADLPGLIRIRLLFAPGDPRRWPPIIAATQQSRARAQPSG